MAANTYFQLQNMAAMITMLLLVGSICGLFLAHWALEAYRGWRRNRAAAATPTDDTTPTDPTDTTPTVVVEGIPSWPGMGNRWPAARQRVLESARSTAMHRAEVLAFRLDGLVEDDIPEGGSIGRLSIVDRWTYEVRAVVEYGAEQGATGWAPVVESLVADSD